MGGPVQRPSASRQERAGRAQKHHPNGPPIEGRTDTALATRAPLIDRQMNDPDAPSEHGKLPAIAAEFRASLSQGRSKMLHSLFDYLLERTLKGESPREIDIAIDVFRRSNLDLVTDASVRVYVHRLRKKLDDYYAGPARTRAERLTLPKGEYRFAIADMQSEGLGDEPSVSIPHRRSARMWLALLMGLVAGALLSAVTFLHFALDDGLEDVRATPIWAPLVASRRPLALVGGDYYIMGERDDPTGDPARLVREFAVNSREDYAMLLMRKPALRDRYVDLDLYLLPIGAAHAIRMIVPVLTPPSAKTRPITVVPSSKLTPILLKECDIVYVGLLNGLGLLQDPVLSGSRFRLAGSFSEIIDARTGRTYAADAPGDSPAPRRDYAYIALLPGPSGNSILIVAGTRDAALRQAVDTLTATHTLRSLATAGKGAYFEALYAVEGIGDENLKATLVAAGARSDHAMWDRRHATVPAGRAR
jgi:hypothetical protein